MTEVFKKGVLTLLKSAVTGEKQSIPEGFDLEEILPFSKKHSLGGMFYYGAVNCGVDTALPAMQTLFFETCQLMAVNERQLHNLNRVLQSFSENGIEHMPLKGSLMKYLYPKTDMRVMGDADILIKPEQYEKIKPIMSELGFTEKLESDHELAWNKPGFLIELHKRLIPSYNKDYYKYYGDGWRLAKPSKDTPHRYEMSDNDQMIYLFTHFAKHYRDGGIGIRHMVDLYVYRNAKPELDEDYIKGELKKLQLYDFYLNIIDTINYWFNNGAITDAVAIIEEFIFNSGVYGDHDSHVLSEAVKHSKSTGSSGLAKIKHLFTIVFLPLENMKKIYPVLVKFPVLLPVMWVVRLVKTVLFKRGAIKAHSEDIKKMSVEKIDYYQQNLNFVGLDFNFKE